MLQKMVTGNSEDSVESCTRKAFKLLPDVSAAIQELTKLKAVGPATASGMRGSTWAKLFCLFAWLICILMEGVLLCSAVLVTGAPQDAAFMADEAVESIPGLVPIKYTLKHYILYLDKVRECAEQLSTSKSAPHVPRCALFLCQTISYWNNV